MNELTRDGLALNRWKLRVFPQVVAVRLGRCRYGDEEAKEQDCTKRSFARCQDVLHIVLKRAVCRGTLRTLGISRVWGSIGTRKPSLYCC